MAEVPECCPNCLACVWCTGWQETSHNNYFISVLLNRARIFRRCASPLNNSIIAGLVLWSMKAILPWSILVGTDIRCGSPPVAGVPLASHKPLPRPQPRHLPLPVWMLIWIAQKQPVDRPWLAAVYAAIQPVPHSGHHCLLPWLTRAAAPLTICRQVGLRDEGSGKGGLWSWCPSVTVCAWRRCEQQG